MSEAEIRRLGIAFIAVILAATFPTWASKAANPPVTYDAPWIYPSLNPTVRAQLEVAPKDNVPKIIRSITQMP
jgi:hypothetical protein